MKTRFGGHRLPRRDPVEAAADEVAGVLADLESLFKPGAKLTFIARRPGNPDQDFMVTNDDDLVELEALVRRRRERGHEG